MKTLKYIYRLLTVGGLLLGASCNDYLDTVPLKKSESSSLRPIRKHVMQSISTPASIM